MMKRILVTFVFAISAAAQADDQEVVDYRQHVMRTMGLQLEALDLILQKGAPADNLATHVKILTAIAPTAKRAFEPEAEGGNAKPEVWANWPDFAKRLDTLVAALNDLANTPKAAADAGLKAKLQALPCKSCHETYRLPLQK